MRDCSWFAEGGGALIILFYLKKQWGAHRDRVLKGANTVTVFKMSSVMRKHVFCISENNSAYQRLSFRYIDCANASTSVANPKFQFCCYAAGFISG